MFTTFGEITQPFIKPAFLKKSVLALIMFYEIRGDKKAYRLLSCVIYTIIKKICIDYLARQSKQLSEIPVCSGGGCKHGDKSFDKILGIGIPYLLMNLISCGGFLRNINSIVILKCPKRIL